MTVMDLEVETLREQCSLPVWGFIKSEKDKWKEGDGKMGMHNEKL